MRKRDIENIAPLPVEKLGIKVKMIATAKILKIGGKDHLIIDFYYNKKALMKVPHLRVVINDKEYANKMNGVWNSKGIKTKDYIDLWNDGIDRENRVDRSDIFVSGDSKKTIQRFEKKVTGHKRNESSWYHPFDSVISIENHIEYKNRVRRENNKQELMDKRMAAVGEVPEEFYEWSRGKLPKGYMYYKRRNARYVDLLCSECGMGYTRAYKRGESFEASLESVIEPPQQNNYCICELCGASTIYKQRGRYENSVYEMNATSYLIEPYENNGAIIRMFNIQKFLRTTEAAEYAITERARLFIGEKLEQIYWKASRWTIDGRWEGIWTWNNPGSAFNPEKDHIGYLWPESNIEDTFLRYSQIEQYSDYGDKLFRPIKYAKVYKEVPELEMVYKLGMTELMQELLERGSYILCKGKDFTERLGIHKKNFKELIRVKGNWETLRMMQLENNLGFDLSVEQREKLRPYYLKLSENKLRLALDYMSITTFIHRIEKYAGMELPSGRYPTCILDKVSHHITTYLDYLDMRNELHHDLSNSVRVCPKNLKEEHDKLVIEQNAEKDKKYIEEKEGKYPHIREQYKQWCKKYEIEFENMHIRPASSAEEIILEGRLQHHCVGGDSYLSKHDEGKSIILLLRQQDKLDVPYVTIEIKDKEIVQWYEAYDKKPNKETVEPWLAKYKQYLKTGKKPREKREELAAAV